MDPRQWLPSLPLFGSLACVYCGGVADTSDHTPPRCLLPKPLPEKVQVMTVPACSQCNTGFSQDEIRTAAIICMVSFTDADRIALAPGGRMRSRMEQDAQLSDFVNSRLAANGMFRPDCTVIEVISRITKKTAAGLLFHEFGRTVHPHDISVIAIDHVKNVDSSAHAELYRRTDGGWAEVTPSGRQLERLALAACGHEPQYMPKWRVYVPKFFEYRFLRRSNDRLLTQMKIHDALSVLLECRWPSRAGPRRNGRPPRLGRSTERADAQ